MALNDLNVLVPTFVVLIAANYVGERQARALSWRGASHAMGGVLAFLIIGLLGTWIGWRYALGRLVVHAACIVALSFRLKPLDRQPGVTIDGIGMVLAASAAILISLGFNSINA